MQTLAPIFAGDSYDRSPLTFCPDPGDSEITAVPQFDLPVCQGSTLISGSIAEADGTVIAIYINGYLAGTTIASGERWSFGFGARLTAGQTITADALAAGKDKSALTQPAAVSPFAFPGSVSGPQNLCAGSTGTYIVQGAITGGGTGAWGSSDTNVATVNQDGEVTAVSPGTAHIVYVITGGCGGTVSASMQIHVREQPYILEHPADQIDCYYRSVSFSIASAGSDLTYTWQRKLPGDEFRDIPVPDPKISYPQPGTITVKDAGTGGNPDGTLYRVVVSNGYCQVVSNEAKLTINRVTYVMGSGTPSNAVTSVICSGENFSYQAAVSYPENVLSYQWMKYHGPNEWRPVSDQSGVSGSQTATVSFNPATTAESGRYYIRVLFSSTDPAGCIASSQSAFSRELLVNPVPTLTSAAQASAVCEGSPAVINLAGLLPNSEYTLHYSINGASQIPLSGLMADGLGYGSFQTPALSSDNHGQILNITALTLTGAEPHCAATFDLSVNLAVYSSPQTIITSLPQNAISSCSTSEAASNPDFLDWLGRMGGAAASDNCLAVTWSHDYDPSVWSADCNAAITVTFTATDLCGNSASAEAVFAIASNPEIECPADILEPVMPDNCHVSLNPGVPALDVSLQPVDWTWRMSEPDGKLSFGYSTTTDNNPTPDPVVPLPPHNHDFQTGKTTIEWTAVNPWGITTCTQTITVVDEQPPAFIVPAGQHDLCVESLSAARFEVDVLTVNPDPDYALLEAGSTLFDLNPVTFGWKDNCCSADELTLNWKIVFADTPDPAAPGSFLVHPPIEGAGQPSGFGADILLPGDGVNFTNVTHRISYRLADCQQDTVFSEWKSADIIVRPRPRIFSTSLMDD